MKRFILAAAAVALSAVAYAALAPYTPEQEARFKKAENLQVVKAVYDVSSDGGSAVAHSLAGAYLPANAIITRSFMYTDTGFSGSGTLALSCETANNILTATDNSGALFATAGNLVEGASSGSYNLMKKITSQCQIAATVAGGSGLTAGKITAWVYYVIHN
jgi:hypothetical protein